MTDRHILLVSRDPGGTNQVVACRTILTTPRAALSSRQREMAERLCSILDMAGDEMPTFAIAGRDYALARWRQLGVVAEEIHAFDNPADERQHIDDILCRIAPDLVVTATSDQDCGIEKQFWEASIAAEIPCYALSTHPANIPSRFYLTDGSPVRPSRILVDSETAAAELRANGIAANGIVVLGDLHLVWLETKARPDPAMRSALRTEWGASEADAVVLFVSECVREMSAIANRVAPFDECACLERLLASISNGTIPGFGKIDAVRTVVVVRPHPKDDTGKYAREIEATRLRVSHSAIGNPIDVLHAADIIVGMESTMLYEAEALRYPVISLVPDGMYARLHASQPMELNR